MKERTGSLRPWIAVCMAVALVISAAGTAFGWAGGPHRWAAEQGTVLFRQGLDDPASISRDREWPLFPELREYSYGWDPWSSYDSGDAEDKTWYMANWEFIKDAAMGADDACWALWGLNHFWRVADGLHDCPYGYDADNSWETTYVLWLRALAAWQLGNLGWAYTQLGYCMHHVQDACCPAHANDDTHDEDQLEDWFSQYNAEHFYSWDGSNDAPAPGPEIPWPSGVTRDNAQLLQDIMNAGCWDTTGCDYPVNDDLGDFPMLIDPGLPWNMQKFFYLLYWADQIGNYFASDDEDGASNAHDPTGWLQGYPGFPTVLHDEDGEEVSIHSWTGLYDNDSCDCDSDGDLTTIATWAYGAAFKASPVLIDLFRRTVDNVPPVTTVEATRADGNDVVEWNNVPVTVRLTAATDYGNEFFRVSGVWKRWGRCEGEPPLIEENQDETPYWVINEEGENHVQLLSTDMCGNVEGDANDFTVKIDMTPPEITFPDLRPNYLTSQEFTATWSATDGLSGVAGETAYLDGQVVTNGQVFDLALMAGLHRLEVYADDVAGNLGYAIYEFKVFIDANAWTKPVFLNDKTKGKGMFCVVEFPVPYDVGLIDKTTCTLAVKATLDLTASDPVVGATAELQAELMTGVGDHDGDHIRDRMLRFDKEQFVAALDGQIGDTLAVVRGGLLPNGMPEFLGVVTVPVFSPPR